MPRPRGTSPEDGTRPAAKEPGAEARPLLLQVLDELCARGLLRLDPRVPPSRPAPPRDGDR
ncbi:hypothetical protein ACFYXS_14380 [Streptomyces sp. NPDC002574]|uniref:hypothetical protein n=1 Tax=Streptomyces sp. NPDC002574 TaxID=3364652 RepID=UPI0036AFA409